MSAAPLAWLLVTGALLAMPGPSPRGDLAPAGDHASVATAAGSMAAGAAQAGSSRPAGERRLSRRGLQAIAATGGGLSAVLLLGWPVGAVVATVIAPVLAAVIGRWADRPQPIPATASLAGTLDLVAAALRSGQPVDVALECAAPAADPPVTGALVAVARLLRLGADPDEAWRVLGADPTLAPVAAAARRSADSGIRLASAFEDLAVEVRAQLTATALARAHRAGALAMLPLGLCFLPAFVCLGVVPVVVGIARTVLPDLT